MSFARRLENVKSFIPCGTHVKANTHRFNELVGRLSKQTIHHTRPTDKRLRNKRMPNQAIMFAYKQTNKHTNTLTP